MNLPKSYTPADHEPEISSRWDAAEAFHAEPDDDGNPYCILIPPPNVTAALHLGHAFNNALQDILVRHHRMRGFNTLWMPGTDHAGIATQAVVEKRLHQQGKRRTDYSRDEFIALVQAWKDEYEATITEQLKLMGCSCDWDRQRFTMDDMCAKAVREAFFQLFREGLIYRGKRLVNWDPATQTALADDEVEMKEVAGKMYYLRYPLVHRSTNANDPKDCQEVTWSELAVRGYPVPNDDEHSDDEKAWITVATTRPETYLGDTAVAVNPDDPRATALTDLCAQLPIVGRVIPIITDDYVVLPDPKSGEAKAQYATGFLKVTPAHDPNDYDIGQRHLDAIAGNSSGEVILNVLAPDATISDQHGWEREAWNEDGSVFVGMSRDDARAKVIDEFKARGLLEQVREYNHSVGHSYRSHVAIEPYMSDQWYVKVTDDRLVGEAQRALSNDQYDGNKPSRQYPLAPGSAGGDADHYDGGMTFFPARYAKMYQSWHDNLRDWCISRQLWWGHRIPVWEYQPNYEYIFEHGKFNEADVRALDTIQEVRDDHANEVDVRWKQELPAISPGLPEREKQRKQLAKKLRTSVENVMVTPEDLTIRVCTKSPSVAQLLTAGGFTQDPDVLDTWFSSGLWPLSTMGWPTPDEYEDTKGLLETFNPTSVLCTAREIITLWVSRMTMFNRFFLNGKIPFEHVYIHAMIQDGHGQKMSKSLGNGVDPRDIIHSHGSDALRFTLTQMATQTQDVRMPVDTVCPHCLHTFHPKEFRNASGYTVAEATQQCPKCSKSMTTVYGAASGEAQPTDDAPLARNTSSKFDLGRNFCNKLWNATRFALTNLSEAKARGLQSVGIKDMSIADRWIISRLHATLHAVEDAIAAYQFNVYADAMYDFIWRDFCDWYLEVIKPTIQENPVQQQVLRTVLNAAMRLLHPICPFVTEALWLTVSAAGEAGINGITLPTHDLLAQAAWPSINCDVHDEEAVATFERAQELTGAIRNLRSEHLVPPKKRITLHVTDSAQQLLDAVPGVVETMSGLQRVELMTKERPSGSIPLTFEGDELLLSGLVDAVDTDAERQRLKKLIAEKTKAIDAMNVRLSNDGYIAKAPPKLVEQTRNQLSDAQADLAAAQAALDSLNGA